MDLIDDPLAGCGYAGAFLSDVLGEFQTIQGELATIGMISSTTGECRRSARFVGRFV